MSERVYRVEHSSVLHKDVPCGPYMTGTMLLAEHGSYGPPFLLCECDHECRCDDCSDCIHEYMDNTAMSDDRHPLPWQDGLGYSPAETLGGISHEDAIFCFDSVQALRNWFIGQEKDLNGFGFVIGVYETDNVRHGGHQSIFDYSRSTRLFDLPL